MFVFAVHYPTDVVQIRTAALAVSVDFTSKTATITVAYNSGPLEGKTNKPAELTFTLGASAFARAHRFLQGQPTPLLSGEAQRAYSDSPYAVCTTPEGLANMLFKGVKEGDIVLTVSTESGEKQIRGLSNLPRFKAFKIKTSGGENVAERYLRETGLNTNMRDALAAFSSLVIKQQVNEGVVKVVPIADHDFYLHAKIVTSDLGGESLAVRLNQGLEGTALSDNERRMVVAKLHSSLVPVSEMLPTKLARTK